MTSNNYTLKNNFGADNRVDWEMSLFLAKSLDFARPLGLTEQRLVEELRHERLVESCEGTPICAVAEILGGDNYTK